MSDPAARLAIQATLTAYSLAVSMADWPAALATFQPDAVWEIPHVHFRFQGHAAILDALTNLGAQMEHVLQLNSPALIEIDGGVATARSGIRECGKTRGREEAFEYLGIYEDALASTPSGWKFTRRTFRAIGTHFWPLLGQSP